MKRGSLWPIGIGVVLAVTVGANIMLYRVAGEDQSFAIEPNYYAKAVGWDSTMAQARRNDALGWHLEPRLDDYSRDGATLRVSLTDASGAPIRDATVRVDALYNARATRIYSVTLAPVDTGYAATLPVRQGGQWELRFNVVRGSDRFTALARVEASPAGGP